MLKGLKHTWLRILLAMIAACSASACVLDFEPEDCDLFAGDNLKLMLSMRMPSPVGATRAAAGLPAEEIRELRVVVVSLAEDSNGYPVAEELPVVEFNKVISSPIINNKGNYEVLTEEIIPDRKKKLYILANCERSKSGYLNIRNAAGTALDLNDDAIYLPTGSNGAAPIEEAIFASPSGKYGAAYLPGSSAASITDYHVPITAIHELTVPTMNEMKQVIEGPDLIYKLKQPLYIVRAVNKIDITVSNETGIRNSTGDGFIIRPLDLRLKSFSISKISTGAQSHLFAHLDKNDELFNEFQPLPGELLKPIYEREDLNPAWMRWLKDEADKSQSNSYKDSYRWLTSYWLPEPSVHEESRDFEFDMTDSPWLPSSKADPSMLSYSMPPVYFPESLYIPDDGSEQQYMLNCTFGQRDGDKESDVTYSAVLPNLKSLFRNTHVKVSLTFTESANVELDLVVLPWYVAPEEEWDYRHTVSIAENGFLTWAADTNENDDTTECRLVLKTDETAAEGKFTISHPLNDEWYAYLIPLTGNPDAFMFVDATGKEIVGNPHGIIDGSPATIRIKRRNMTTDEQNTAKLQIMVRTADNRYLEADVCYGEPTYYTIIQNRNSF